MDIFPVPFKRSTEQRRLILQEVKRLHTHPSASDLYKILRLRLPRISLGTVYRNLEILARAGEIQKIENPGGETRFDGNPAPHYHVRCDRCGRVDDVRDRAVQIVPGDLGEVEGYEISGYRLELRGLCPACRRRATQEGAPGTAEGTDGVRVPRTAQTKEHVSHGEARRLPGATQSQGKETRSC
ncbi:MAG: transcriptional repressor [Planctomycetes bacterium]|nr:transcriptional repressor [Planctomycetota bacterium]